MIHLIATADKLNRMTINNSDGTMVPEYIILVDGSNVALSRKSKEKLDAFLTDMTKYVNELLYLLYS